MRSTTTHPVRIIAVAIVLSMAPLLIVAQANPVRSNHPPAGAYIPTVREALTFIARAEHELDEDNHKQARAAWVAATYITEDTQEISAEEQNRFNIAAQHYAIGAKRFDRLVLPDDLRRKLTLLKLPVYAPPPSNSDEAAELTRLVVGLEAEYGRGTYCRPLLADQKQKECRQINALSQVLATSRDPKELLDAWVGWHAIGRPMRQRYARFVELSNKGARELGFADAGATWRAGYDMPPDAFALEVDRLWKEVEPLYVALHAYVRTRLVHRYGPETVPPDGMIPAHLLGNMWAQVWGNVYDVIAPDIRTTSGAYDLTELLKRRKIDAVGMVRYGERFFTSLGFDSLPATFWTRSMFVKPRDREVICQASAWDIDGKTDLRIKACLEPTADLFTTAHHELGHNFYQRAYSRQPYLFRSGANDGFHEAIGDAVTLSITPTYLKQVGLLDTLPSAADDTLYLLRRALDKIAILPFSLLVDQWRWNVFSGAVKPTEYNTAWWALRNKYQGVAAPTSRTEADFDPGAKYHIAANVPYARYFLANVLQYQFYRAMCRAAGHTGPLYRCSFFGSKAAGAKLASMLDAGQSRPWQETLAAMTGERNMNAGALLEYYGPLKVWLDQQNRGHPVGWNAPAGTPSGIR